MTNFILPMSNEEHIAAGDKVCNGCNRWFKPNGVLTVTRCTKCIGIFLHQAIENGWVTPIVDPVWPEIEYTGNENRFVPKA